MIQRLPLRNRLSHPILGDSDSQGASPVTLRRRILGCSQRPHLGRFGAVLESSWLRKHQGKWMLRSSEETRTAALLVLKWEPKAVRGPGAPKSTPGTVLHRVSYVACPELSVSVHFYRSLCSTNKAIALTAPDPRALRTLFQRGS